MDEEWLGVFFLVFFREVVEEVGGEDFFVEVLDGVLWFRSVLFEETRFVLPHATGDLVDGFVDAFVHVVCFRGGVDDDVVGTKENDFSDVALFLYVEDRFGFDDAGVVEMNSFYFLFGVVAE